MILDGSKPLQAPRAGRLGSWLTILAVSATLLLGCAKQGEGERCDTKNDNQDCESGLICTSLRSLNRGTQGAVCCPDQGTSSASVCRQGSLDFDDDAPSEDTPTDDTTGTDDEESATDTAPTDGATDDPTPTDPGPTPADAGNADAGDASN